MVWSMADKIILVLTVCASHAQTSYGLPIFHPKGKPKTKSGKEI